MVNTVTKDRILELYQQGQKPTEILRTLKKTFKKLDKSQVTYVISYYGRKASKTKTTRSTRTNKTNPTVTSIATLTPFDRIQEQLEIASQLSSETIVSMARFIAFTDALTFEKRINLLQDMLSKRL